MGGSADDAADGAADGSVDGAAAGASDGVGAADGAADSAADGAADGVGAADGAADSATDGAADSSAVGSVDGAAGSAVGDSHTLLLRGASRELPGRVGGPGGGFGMRVFGALGGRSKPRPSRKCALSAMTRCRCTSYALSPSVGGVLSTAGGGVADTVADPTARLPWPPFCRDA